MATTVHRRRNRVVHANPHFLSGLMASGDRPEMRKLSAGALRFTIDSHDDQADLPAMIWRGVYFTLLAAVGALSFGLTGRLPVGGPVLVATTLMMAVLCAARVVAYFIRYRPDSPLADVRTHWRAVARWAFDRWLLLQSSILFFSWLPPIKAAIPDRAGYWADAYLARWEHAVFDRHPWEILHQLPDVITTPVDFLYSSWVILMIIVSLGIATFAPAKVVGRYFVSWGMAWVILGIIVAHALPSAGPIFGPDLGFGFEALHRELQGTTAMRFHDGLWHMQSNRIDGLGGGISAMPSMHCALTFVFAAAARGTRLWWPTVTYAAFIWFGSVYLGWHYALDGLVSLIGVGLIWRLALALTRDHPPLSWRSTPPMREAQTGAAATTMIA